MSLAILASGGLSNGSSLALRRTFSGADLDVVLLGTSVSNLGGSEYLKIVHGRVAGEAPAVDLAHERALIQLLTKSAERRLIQSAHDCSDGGLAVTLAECSFDTGGLGCSVNLAGISAAAPWEVLGALFGEAAGRAVVTVKPEDRDALLRAAGTARGPTAVIGRTGGARIQIAVNGTPMIDMTVVEAERLWATAIEKHFAGRAA